MPFILYETRSLVAHSQYHNVPVLSTIHSLRDLDVLLDYFSV